MSGVALRMRKHGRSVVIAKLVRVAGEVVLAMPYRHRPFATPSLPPAALELARQAGATKWVVRFDVEGRCYELPLEDVERVGTVGDDGEVYVLMRHFRPTRWYDWPFVTEEVVIEATA